MVFGDRVKKLRIDNGLSQQELAALMGYKSRSSINKIENGRPVTQKVIVKLATALNTTPAHLMGWDENGIPSELEEKIVEAYRNAPPEVKAIIDRILLE